MEDSRIIELYNERSEDAIAQTAVKYGAYLDTIAFNILSDSQDAEECVSDTYMRTWNAIPPTVPPVLRTFLGKITRNLAIDRYKESHAAKRGGGNLPACLDELAECVASQMEVAANYEYKELVEILNEFLDGLNADQRQMFVRRYFYVDSIRDIAERYGYSESKVKTSLFRIREDLRKVLTKEGFEI